MRSVVDRNIFMRRIAVVGLCFKWDCKRVKTEKTWKGRGGVGVGGEGFEFTVSLTVEIFFNIEILDHYGIFKRVVEVRCARFVVYLENLPCSWAKRTKKNVFQSFLLVDSGIRHHMNSCVRVTHNSFFSLECAGGFFIFGTYCILSPVRG